MGLCDYNVIDKFNICFRGSATRGKFKVKVQTSYRGAKGNNKLIYSTVFLDTKK